MSKNGHFAAVASGAVVLVAIACFGGAHAAKESPMRLKTLTPEEERVIIDQGTEAPFTGKLLGVHEPGVFRCKHCGAPLFPSSAKFDSRTGWPSFDDAFPGAVN